MMSILLKRTAYIFLLTAGIACFNNAYSQSLESILSGVIGRWDITILKPDGSSDFAWLEIEKSGNNTLVGYFVGHNGSVRPVSEINFSPEDQTFSFTIPPQWDPYKLKMEFKLKGDELAGWESHPPQTEKMQWKGVRAPDLVRASRPVWGNPIHLLKNSLSDWKLLKGNDSLWTFKNGILRHDGVGGNIVTKQKFDDFKLHVEFRLGKGANSGIYLRGRYEVQVEDSYGAPMNTHMLGSIYGFLIPTINAARAPGQWQTYDITLRGRMATVVLNGTTIICNRPIPGITGEALDSHEGEPGPIMLQGSERGLIEYRNIIITPAVNK